MHRDKSSNEQLIRSEAKRLWTENFDDEARFVDFYFERIFRAEECKIRFDESGEKAIAQIHLPRYQFTLAKGQELEANYISGACTSLPYRQRGVMSDMLEEVLLEAEAEGEISASFLIPASADLARYYREHFGYECLIYRQESTELGEIAQMTEAVELEEDYFDCLPFLMACEEQAEVPRLRHSAQQWQNVLDEYKLNPQISWVADWRNDEGALQSLAFVHLDETKGELIVDALYGSALAKCYLLEHLAEKYNKYKIKAYICRGNKSDASKPYVMMRPLKLLPFLIAYAHRNRDLDLTFSVEDKLIEEHNKTFHIVEGEVQEVHTKVSRTYSIAEFVRNFVFVKHIALLHE